MTETTAFIFVRGMVQGLANKYNVSQEDLDELLKYYDQINPQAVKGLKDEGLI